MSRRTMLSDLEIDEVSTVDRPANQHGLITFSKRDANGNHNEETLMSQGTAEIEVFDAEGAPVDVDSLEHGALVYDGDGNEFMYSEADDDFEDDDDDEVGKSAAGTLFEAGRKGLRSGYAAGKGGKKYGAKLTDEEYNRFKGQSGALGVADRAGRVGSHVGRNKKAYQYGTAGTGVAVAGGAGYSATKKSLGDSVLEELSKAVNDDQRSAIIAKAMDEVQFAKAQAAEALIELDYERDLRLEKDFIAKADEYNLPVDPSDFGPVLKRLVERMDEEDLEVLDSVFKAAGDLLFQEYGHVGGGSNSSIIDSVDALAGEMVAKAGGDFTTAEAQVALFEANPEAYDAYLQEGR